ncbi:MAG: fibronectin type III domain-containing protein, partial [Lachnospiraceae bacterium]
MKRNMKRFLSFLLAAAMVIAMNIMTVSAESEAQKPVDNTTILAEGNYVPDDFTFAGGTGKLKIQCSSFEVEDETESGKTVHKVYADLVFTSSKISQLVAGGFTYYPDDQTSSTTEFEEVPIVLNQDQVISATTTAMSEPHAVDYTVKLSFDDGSTVDNTTSAADGTYAPDDFTYAGGTGKVAIACESITVTGGKAYGKLVMTKASTSSSAPATERLQTAGKTFMASTSGNKKVFSDVPLALNKDQRIIVQTMAMSEPHDIAYTIKTTLNASTAFEDLVIDVASAAISQGKLVLTWKAPAAEITNYQIQYATNAKYSDKKTVKASGPDAVKYTSAVLTPGKTYYVRIRAYYKKADGSNAYTAWTPKADHKVYTPNTTVITGITKPAAKQLTIKWNALTSYTTGYQVRYWKASESSSAAKTVKIADKTRTSATLKSLISKQQYKI